MSVEQSVRAVGHGDLGIRDRLTQPAVEHVRTLEKVGYVRVEKSHVGKRPRTWLSLRPTGDAAFRAHYETLRAIAGTQ